MESIERFFNESPLAQKVKLRGRVVVHRGQTSSQDARDIQKAGHYETDPAGAKCEYEVTGKVLALGKIVKIHGEYFFRVTQLEESAGEETT